MRRTQVRIGQALIAAGLLILSVQVAMLLSARGVAERRAEVLRGDVEYNGQSNVRPLVSVLGVFFLTGGLFTLALSGSEGKKGP